MKQAVQKQKLDMLNGSLWNKIPQFALPVAATAILEQLFNASDIAVVGNFSGAASTIAVAAAWGVLLIHNRRRSRGKGRGESREVCHCKGNERVQHGRAISLDCS